MIAQNLNDYIVNYSRNEKFNTCIFSTVKLFHFKCYLKLTKGVSK